jgi:hypothetical protein
MHTIQLCNRPRAIARLDLALGTILDRYYRPQPRRHPLELAHAAIMLVRGTFARAREAPENTAAIITAGGIIRDTIAAAGEVTDHVPAVVGTLPFFDAGAAALI